MLRSAPVSRWIALAGLLACAAPLFAAIDGVVTNGTTGQPEPNADVLLIKPGQQGMKTIGQTKSDSQGRFRFDNDQPGGGPQLVQIDYQGVHYNKLLTPNMPTSGVDISVFESTKSPSDAKIVQHMIVVQPSDSQINVGETVIVQNSSKLTFANSELGGLRFFLPPPTDGQSRVEVQGPGSMGMPLPRAAEKTSEDNVYKVDYPIKPGETQFNVSYVLPIGSPATLRGRIAEIKGQATGPVRFVAPPGVTLESKDLRQLGQEPQTQSLIYDLANVAYTINVAGMGSLGGAAEDDDESDHPTVEQKNPPIYQHFGWLLGLSLGVLVLAVALLYRQSPTESSPR